MFQRRALRRRPTRVRAGAGGRWPPWPVALPSLLIVLLLLLPPLYLLIRAASLGAGGALEILLRPRTALILGRTVLLAGATTTLSILIGLPLAWLTTSTDLPGRRFWLVATVLPLAMPSFIGGYVIVAALGPRGLLQQLLEGPFGVTRIPEIYGFPGALLALTLFSYPYVLLAVRAGLRGLDPALAETARSLGHGPPAVFFRLTLPLLRPAITAGGLLVALYALSDFGAVSLLQFDSFTRVIYLQYISSLNRASAALFALMLVALTLTILYIEGKTRGQGRFYEAGSGSRRRARPLPLGRWRLPALLFCALITLVALGMPIGVLLFWLVRGLRAGESLRALWGPAANSLLGSGLAALVTTAAAVPLAFWTTRFPGRPAVLVGRVAYIGYALPGVVVALALVFVGARVVPIVYQTLPMLIFAYLVRFLPQALGAVATALAQVNPRIEEAARSLGSGPLHVLATVTLPLTRGGLTSAAALVFLTTMKELPSTLLLAPIGFDTLATRTWSAAGEGFFALAAAPALLLVLVSALSLLPVLATTRD